MRDIGGSLRKCVGIGFLFTLGAMSIASPSTAACYSTPRAAIDALTRLPSLSPASKSGGYRVTRIELDKVLSQRWAMIARCDHPEWPAVAFPADELAWLAPVQVRQLSVADGAGTAPIVRAGDVVRLWKQESALRMELAGVAEQSGGLGKTIRVRLLYTNANEQSISEQFSGVIRGPLDVEMQSR
jgi:hypothetical protein